MKFIKSDNRIKLIQENYNREQYQNLLSDNDINLAPSKFEGFGLTLLEALHARVPTITINNSPMNEIVSHNENGLCISAEEVDKIQNQPIYEIDRQEFVKEFSRLVKKPSEIYTMKLNTTLCLEKNRTIFFKTINKVFNSFEK